jgi:hypothetical protein
MDARIAELVARLTAPRTAFHEAGLSSLTPDGVRLAREWDPCSLYARRDRRWYLKVRTNARPEGTAVSHSESGSIAVNACRMIAGPVADCNAGCHSRRAN